jgi:hypothetical protein
MTRPKSKLIPSDFFVAGVVIWTLAIAAPGTILHPTLMKCLIVLAAVSWVACFGAWVAVGIKTGKFRWRYHTVDRSENAVHFWLCVSLHVFIVAVVSAAYLSGLVRKYAELA